MDAIPAQAAFHGMPNGVDANSAGAGLSSPGHLAAQVPRTLWSPFSAVNTV